MRQGFLVLPQSTFSADSLTVSVQPLAIACVVICAHVTNSKHRQLYHCLDRQKYCTHFIEMGGAALVAAVPYQVRPPAFPVRNKEVLKKQQQKKQKNSTNRNGQMTERQTDCVGERSNDSCFLDSIVKTNRHSAVCMIVFWANFSFYVRFNTNTKLKSLRHLLLGLNRHDKQKKHSAPAFMIVFWANFTFYNLSNTKLKRLS